MPQVMDTTFLHEDNAALIFSPIGFRHLTVKNRLFRSNISGSSTTITVTAGKRA